MVYKHLDPARDWDAWCDDHPEPPEWHEVDEKFWQFECGCEEVGGETMHAPDVRWLYKVGSAVVEHEYYYYVCGYSVWVQYRQGSRKEVDEVIDGERECRCNECGAVVEPSGYDVHAFIEDAN